MKIDITMLSEDEPIDLNRRIVERLRFLSQTHAHHKMLQFKVVIGELQTDTVPRSAAC